MDGTAGCRGWFDHLSDADIAFLARVSAIAGVEPRAVRSNPEALIKVLAHPAAFDAVFGASSEGEFLPASPFLSFALLVHRGWVELQRAHHVDEWVGPRQRLPVLGGDDLRSFLAPAQHRLFLTELLSSYTRVTSGSSWVHTPRGWRRRRFSELDPVRLASLLDAVPEAERPGVYRRLGDLALFLTGVFPDHTEIHGLGPLDEARLLRLSGLTPERQTHEGWGTTPTGAVGVLERLGERWYRLASRSVGPLTGTMPVVAEVAENFGVARRSLNYLTDRYLFVRRSRWFGEPAT
jgi:hypothetical protein